MWSKMTAWYRKNSLCAFPKAGILLRADGSAGCLEQYILMRWLRLRWLNSNFWVVAGRACTRCCHWKNQGAERLGTSFPAGKQDTQGRWVGECWKSSAAVKCRLKREGGEGAWRMGEDLSPTIFFFCRGVISLEWHSLCTCGFKCFIAFTASLLKFLEEKWYMFVLNLHFN